MNRDKEEILLDPKTPEFKEMILDYDPLIEFDKFLEIARKHCASSIPDTVSGRARQQMIDSMVSIEMNACPDLLFRAYYEQFDPDIDETALCEILRNGQEDRMIELENEYAAQMGKPSIERTADVDRVKSNGMTPLGQIIMSGDDVDAVELIITEQMASPHAKSMGMTPLEIANMLGREKIKAYLEELISTA